MTGDAAWPPLPYSAWKSTCETLHLWTQIAGKIRLMLTPWLNHSWHVPLYVTVRGLGSSPIPCGNDLFEIEFDLIDHLLLCRTSTGEQRTVALVPQTVADFYARVMAMLADLNITVSIDNVPNEIANPTHFPDDVVHAASSVRDLSARPALCISSGAVSILR